MMKTFGRPLMPFYAPKRTTGDVVAAHLHLPELHAFFPSEKLLFHLLNGHNLAALPVHCLQNTPVRTIPQLLCYPKERGLAAVNNSARAIA